MTGPRELPVVDAQAVAWAVGDVGEAMIALARLAGVPVTHVSVTAPAGLDAQWMASAGRLMGAQVEQHDVPHGEIDALSNQSQPALVPVGGTADAGYVLACAGRGRVLTPERRLVRLSSREWHALVCGDLERSPADDADRLLDSLGLPGSRRERARRQLVGAQLAEVTVPMWTIDFPIDASLGRLASRTGVARQACQLVCAHGAYLLLWMLAWWLVGAAALGGHLDRGWLNAWMLLLATLVPLRMAALWVQATLAVGAGAVLKERLLVGALRVDPDRLSGDGAGALLGRAIEADAVESLALTGGFSACRFPTSGRPTTTG